MSEINANETNLPVAPNPFFQLLKGLGYFCLFLCCNLSVTLIFMTHFGMELLAKNRALGINTPLDQLDAYMTQKTYEHAN